MSSTLLIERQGAVETWTMNDPATRNALSDAVVDGLLQACARAAQDATLRIVVLTGAGGAFCAGGSLGGFASLIGQPLQDGQTDPLLAMNRGFGDLLHALSALPQLLVCRVDGAAMGGGFGLVCCADHVVATDALGAGHARGHAGPAACADCTFCLAASGRERGAPVPVARPELYRCASPAGGLGA